MTGVRPLAVAVIAGLATAASAAAADAAVVSGSNLAHSPGNAPCFDYQAGDDCTVTIQALQPERQAAGGAKAAIDGVIVSWRIRTGSSASPHPIALRVVHGGVGGGSGPREMLPSTAGTYPFVAGLPVQAGDEIGIDIFEVDKLGAPPVTALTSPDGGAHEGAWAPRLQTGSSAAGAMNAEAELALNVTIEPDADHDGYGDESQDPCPALAGTNPCPVAPVARPDTAITRGPSGRIHSRTAIFEFRSDPPGTTFECKFDQRKFKPCASPRKYKHLGLGKHRFQVRAVNAAGADSIPAARSFRIAP